MKRIIAILAAVALIPAAAAAQSCLGLTAQARQLSTGALYSRSQGVTSYGAAADANFAGPLSAGVQYIYSGDIPSVSERNIHTIRLRGAYELSAGSFSLCPSLGAGYEDGSSSFRSPLDGTMLHPAWRRLTVPLLLNAGIRLDGPGSLVLVPRVSAGGIGRYFIGRNAAYPLGGDTPVDLTDSQLGWAAAAGLTVGWQRFWVAGTATESSLPGQRPEWILSAGWVIPWELFGRVR